MYTLSLLEAHVCPSSCVFTVVATGFPCIESLGASTWEVQNQYVDDRWYSSSLVFFESATCLFCEVRHREVEGSTATKRWHR